MHHPVSSSRLWVLASAWAAARPHARLAAFFAVSLSIACGGGGSCGSDAPTRTVKDQCTDIMTPLCKRLVTDCNVPGAGPIEKCVEDGVPACCATGCAAGAITAESEIQTCVAAVDAASCASLYDGTKISVPTSCVQVVKRPATSVEPSEPLMSQPAAALGERL